MITLVCGLRGSGKSTWCKNHLGDGLCYDMDAIASAFRLKMPHEEYHTNARHMANEFLWGFLTKAEEYTDNVLIIRTAPRIEEVEEIHPDRVVILRRRYVERPMDDAAAAAERLDALEDWCRANGIPPVTP